MIASYFLFVFRTIVCSLLIGPDVLALSTMLVRCFYIVMLFAVASATPRQAIAHFNGVVRGQIMFSESSGGQLSILGAVEGLQAGRYGIHVHALGDTTSCYSAGPHFNPLGNAHGSIDSQVRHMGDLGNLVVGGGLSPVNFFATMSLRGANSILGRTLVIHQNEDDLGQGGHSLSATTGNSGARIDCAVIGIYGDPDAWNSAGSISPTVLLFILSAASIFYLW